MKIKIIIGAVSAVAVLAIIGAVLFFGNFFKKDPKLAVTEAAANTLNEFTETIDSTYADFQRNVMSGQYKADVSLGINDVSGGAFASVEPSILSAARMFTLKDSLRYDPVNKRREDKLTIQLAVTPLAELILYADPTEVALSAPIAFDYYVTADPEHFPNAWNNSIIGRTLAPDYGYMLEGPMEKTIYDTYESVWFPAPYEEPAANFNTDLYMRILDANTEYLYVGSEKLADGEWEKNCDAYDVTFTRETLQTLIDAVMADLIKMNELPQELVGDYVNQLVSRVGSVISGNETLRVFVADNKIAGADIGGERIYFKGGDINLSEIHLAAGDGLIDLNLAMQLGEHLIIKADMKITPPGAAVSEVSMDYEWDNTSASDDNFSLKMSFVTGDETAELSANGSYNVTEEHSDMRLDNLAVKVNGTDIEAEIDLSYSMTVRADSEPVEVTGERKALTDVNEMDVLFMYTKLLENPQIGALLGQIGL